MKTWIHYNRRKRRYEVRERGTGHVLARVLVGGRTQAERRQMDLEAPGLLAQVDGVGAAHPDCLNRAHRAGLLVAQGGVRLDGDPGRFYVRSQRDRTRMYHVDAEAWTCGCEACVRYGQVCAHVLAARFFQALQGEAPVVDSVGETPVRPLATVAASTTVDPRLWPGADPWVIVAGDRVYVVGDEEPLPF